MLLAQHNQVTAYDIIQDKVDMINAKQSPIIDHELQEFLSSRELQLCATTDAYKAFSEAEYIIISTPTDYDPDRNFSIPVRWKR